MVNAGHHILDDFFGGVPDAEVFAELWIESFEKWLVEVGDGFVFAEGIEKSGLNAVEGFTGEIEYLLELDGVECSWFRDLAEELAKNGDAEIMGCYAPIESSARCAALGGAPPENPCGEDAVKEGLNKSGTEEVFSLFAFKPHAKRFLESAFNGIEAAERMVLSAGTGFAGVGGQQPCNVFGLGERGAVKHDARQEVGQQIFVIGEAGERRLPKIGSGSGQGVAFEGLNCARCRKLKKPKFAEVGNEDQAVLAQIAKRLRLCGERVEVVVGGLDLDNAALRILEKFRLSAATLALWLGKKAPVGETRSAVAKLGREQDGGFERLAD
jgi:hypothetical protein